MNKKILVTKSFLPPLDKYVDQIKRIFDNECLTNRGVLVRELETSISFFLQLKNAKVLITNNGTVPLQIALKLLGGNGEIITTPFSYVATTSSIVWEGCSPVFVDIDPDHLVIDENKIEAAITEKTTCILATHVFGNPCNVVRINEIAEKYAMNLNTVKTKITMFTSFRTAATNPAENSSESPGRKKPTKRAVSIKTIPPTTT
jgi:dTDP-4-amino-4,6-dideoxygalactose transaminase